MRRRKHLAGNDRARWLRVRLVVALTLALGAWPVLSAGAVGVDRPPPPLPPSTKPYVAHLARLTTQIPADWRPVPGPYNDHVGPDGFIAAGPLPGEAATLEAACAQSVVGGTFGSAPTTRRRQLGAHEVCQIDPSGDQPAAVAGQHAVVVRHPHPFDAFGERVEFVFILADGAHLPSIAARLDFDLAAVTPVAYLESAIDLVEVNSFFGDPIAWDQLRDNARARSKDARSLADIHPTLTWVVGQLRQYGDNHSFFLAPAGATRFEAQEAIGLGVFTLRDRVILVYPGGPADQGGIRVGDWIQRVAGRAGSRFDPGTWDGQPVPITLVRAGTDAAQPIEVTVIPGEFSAYLDPRGRRLPGGVGYVEIFGAASEPVAAARYATTAQEVVAGIDEQPTCGWVIDLRRNLGGSYAPMVAGVGAILGDGPFAGWVDAAGTMTTVEYRDGAILDDGDDIVGQLVEGPLYELKRPMPPVAVLIGPATSSSGEVTAIAFIGRPETRFFGERSGGFTTANSVYPLFDGAWLVLAVAAQSDRTGAVYPAGVLPDEAVATDWATFGTDADPVLRAALAWLGRHEACATATGDLWWPWR